MTETNRSCQKSSPGEQYIHVYILYIYIYIFPEWQHFFGNRKKEVGGGGGIKNYICLTKCIGPNLVPAGIHPQPVFMNKYEIPVF